MEASVLPKVTDNLADKGFEIQDILASYGACLTVPPFLGREKQMSAQEVVRTKQRRRRERKSGGAY